MVDAVNDESLIDSSMQQFSQIMPTAMVGHQRVLTRNLEAAAGAGLSMLNQSKEANEAAKTAHQNAKKQRKLKRK